MCGMEKYPTICKENWDCWSKRVLSERAGKPSAMDPKDVNWWKIMVCCRSKELENAVYAANIDWEECNMVAIKCLMFEISNAGVVRAKMLSSEVHVRSAMAFVKALVLCMKSIFGCLIESKFVTKKDVGLAARG